MTSYTDVSGVEYDYTYDGMGRATNLTSAGQQVVSATYGPANQLATLGSETRQYNSLLQLTGIVWGARSMTYNYPANNNGFGRFGGQTVKHLKVNWATSAWESRLSCSVPNSLPGG